MLIRMVVHNFKRFDKVEIELGNPVVFIGPNNCGKTTALQALALWHIGVSRWHEKRGGRDAPEKRPGVTISRRDLVAVPVPAANLLWRNLKVRDGQRVDGRQKTQNIRVDILVEGVTGGERWECGLEFDYANEESFYCRPLRISDSATAERMPVPPKASQVEIAFLPPMSGLAAREDRLDTGAVNVRIGEGRTAEVLRNLCYQIASSSADKWAKLVSHIRDLFGVTLNRPVYIEERGEIVMSYGEVGNRAILDLSAAGRGLHQTLLLLAYLYANPGAVLLLDEPDAHLEILRQREIYQLLVDTANEQGSQIIAASHSEVLLNEAADRDVVVAFVGKPHRIDNRGSQVLKALKSIGFEHYYLAERMGWVLYLEGSTDLANLRAFAQTINHPAAKHLERPFVHYVDEQPQKAKDHFYGLKEAKPDLKGIAVFDRLDSSAASTDISSDSSFRMLMWKRRELENYLFYPEVLLAYARGEGQPDLFTTAQQNTMEQCIGDLVPPLALRDRDDLWWSEVKASEILERLFKEYFKRLKLPNVMSKSNYHELARLVPQNLIAPEVIEKLDAIVDIASTAKPTQDL
ncbi:MAG: AAA family ATPase [Chloroflexi bacterium]|nr:AAA family ATPase [Chloroflexota bacterium]